ncbi:amino acid adenylation domain-containing protein, partial [Chromobacterium alticapitis]
MMELTGSTLRDANQAPWKHCLHTLIEEQAKLTPEAEAVCDERGWLSYAELNARANRCAHFLREMGVGPDVVVGVTMDRSVHLMVALLAILKAGGAYLPLDAGLPQARLSFMASDAEVFVLLTQQPYATRWASLGGIDTVLSLDSEAAFLDRYPVTPVEPLSSPDDLAYVLYTSGSTGQPKGCMLPHGAVANRLLWMQAQYQLQPGERVLQKTPITFDVSVWELFWPLLTGAVVVMAAPGGHKDAHYLARTLREQRIAVCHFVPSMLRFFLEEPDAGRSPSLRDVFVSGEALPHAVMTRYFEVMPGRLHNLYGPTEAAVDVSHWTCEQRPDGKVPIGKAISNVELKVLDPSGRPVSPGEEGELHIGGVALARGYLRRPDLTAASFVPDPEHPDARLYRTGDRVRELPDGNLEYLGRIDFQVKLRGQRLELGEIETVLRRYPGVRDAAVTVRGEEEGDAKLVAYVETDPPQDGAAYAKHIRRFAAEQLPDYMVPSLVATLPTMPVSVHGKLDRRSLPWPLDAAPLAEAFEPRPAPQRALSADDLREALRAAIQGTLGGTPVENDADLFDLGATSLTLIRIAHAAQELTGGVVPVDALLDQPTLNGIFGFLRARLPVIEPAPQDKPMRGGAADPLRRELPGKLQKLVCGLLRRDSIGQDEDWFELGATSLTLTQIVQAVRERYAVGIPVDALLNSPTLASLTDYLLPRLSAVVPLREPDLQDWARPDQGDTASSPSDEPMPLERFAAWLGQLRAGQENGANSAKYLYPSSGGLNAVRAYVALKPGAVAGLSGGVYYYDPVRHALIDVGAGAGAAASILQPDNFSAYDAPLLGQSRASVFLVAATRAILPIYGHAGAGLLLLEAGYMQQLLRDPRQSKQITVEPAAWLASDRLHGWLGLSDDERIIQVLLLGRPGSPRRAPLAAFLDDGGALPALPAPDGASRLLCPERQPTNWGEVAANKGEEAAIRAEQRQFRRFDASAARHPLPGGSFDWPEYRLRASRRRFTDTKLSLDALGGLLSLARSRDSAAARLALAPDALALGGCEIRAWLREGAIDGLAEGCYRYDAERHQLVWLAALSADQLALAYTPYNRQHFKTCAFALFLMPAKRHAALPDAQAERFDLLAAGAAAQNWVRYQADFGLGLCPIGGLLFDRIADAFEVEPLHSLVGGPWPDSTARPRLLRTADAQMPLAVEDKRGVAIIGLAGRMPGADSLDGYAALLRGGRSAIAPPSAERAALFAGNGALPPGGYLEGIDRFDSQLFHISPAEAKRLDPQERLLLETAWSALENAGYSAATLRAADKRVAVFVGAMWNDYQSHGVEAWRQDGQIREASYHASLANRLSFFFDFGGPSIAVNTSCSSAMAAVHLARESLLRGECELALVAGVNLISHAYHLRMLADSNYLSASGVSRPFSAAADGWAPGEGVGVILLKPLDAARRDGDQIHGLILGSAIGHSARASRFGAPVSSRQAQCMRQALASAGLAAEDIDYIEAAAPGASLADAAEIEALRSVFCAAPRRAPCRVGSVKGNVGHLESASLFSQLFKVLAQFRDGAIYPSLNSEPANPLIADDDRLAIARSQLDWQAGDRRRIAMINAQGAAGTGGQLLIAEPSAADLCPQRPEPSGIPQCIALSAADNERLRALARELFDFLSARTELALDDIAFTLAQGRAALPQRLAIIAQDGAALRRALSCWLSAQQDTAGEGFATLSGRAAADAPDSASANDDAQIQARAWVAGAPAAGPRPDGRPPRRLALPGYPFAPVRHWIDAPSAAPADASGDAKSLRGFLLREVARVTELPLRRIDMHARLEELGLSSLMMESLTRALTDRLGSVPPTLFFECRSLEDVARRLDGLSMAAPRPQARAVAADAREPIAIVGLSGRYPKADSLDEFWRRLSQGEDCVEEIPPRWDHQAVFSSERGQPGRTYSKWGGFLSDVDAFDPLFFNMSPRDAALTDPQIRLFMQTAWHAVEDAGYNRDSLRRGCQSRVGVFVGVMYGEYQLYPSLGPDLPFSGSFSAIANRVSYALDLKGPSLAVDTMCSSSLTALHLAVESMRAGDCDWALAGGVNLSLHPSKYVSQAMLTMSSSDGRCRSFGEGGDGFVPAEGVGAVLLKPLSRALADGDHIYGLIRGSAINHGGRTNGYTVPDPAAHAEVIRAALARADLSPSRIGYIEAHGTGTALGDPIEIAGLSQAFGDQHRGVASCRIGSVKSNIGHAESAAGIAGLTKVLLQMRAGQLAPSLHSARLNPRIDFASTPFTVVQGLQDWPRQHADNGAELPRVAGISSFGAGGANAHLIVEEYLPEAADANASSSGPVLLMLSAMDDERLREYAASLLRVLSASARPAGTLRDVAYTLQVGRETLKCRLAIEASTPEQARNALTAFLERRPSPDLYLDASQAAGASPLCAQAARWLRTGELDVDALYQAGPAPRRLPLPGYPFAKERYWATLDTAPPQAPPPVWLYQEDWQAQPATQAPSRWPDAPLCLVSTPRQQQALSTLLTERHAACRPMFATHPQAQARWREQNLTIEVIDPASPAAGLAALGTFDAALCLWPLSEQEYVRDGGCLLPLLSALPSDCGQLLLAGRARDDNELARLEAWLGTERTRRRAAPSLRCAIFHGAADDDFMLSRIADEAGRAMEDSVLYRNEARHQSRLSPLPAPQDGQALRRGGVYLISGGLGHIGLLLSRHLAKRHAAKLALLGSGPLDEEKQRSLDELAALGGEAIYLQSDIADQHAVHEAVRQTLARFGALHGVVHVAGRLHHAALADALPAERRAVLDAKIAGALALERATAGLSLDFFCHFSSLSAVLGDFGACDYAMANRFLLAHARLRQARVERGEASGRSIAIAWPFWRDGGMRQSDQAAERYLAASGLVALDTDLALTWFETLLAGGASHPVLLAGEYDKVARLLPAASPAAGRLPPRAELQGLDLKQSVVWDLKTMAGDLLKLERGRIDADEMMTRYGFDSISLAQLSLAINARYGVATSPAMFYTHASLNAVADSLLSEDAPRIRQHYGQGASGQSETPPQAAPAAPAPRATPASPAESEAIAIIGMSGRFPDARDIDEFWRILAQGLDTVREIPAERFDWRDIYSDAPAMPGKTVGKWLAAVPGVDEFDPLFFEISPRDAQQIDPRQRLLLQESWRALEDAGLGGQRLARARVGMYVGVEQGDYQLRLPTGSGNVTANHDAILAARLAYSLNLSGPVMAINTACSSGLVAVHQACMALRQGECDVAVAAAANLLLGPDIFVSLGQAGMLSADGRTYAFDQRANGLVPGEAVVALTLKPLSQALADGDPIHAVIRASGINYDGKTNGIMAPSGSAQARLLRDVYRKHHVNVAELDYVIAHGTGTRLGDPVEIGSLHEAFAELGDRDIAHCAITSTKPNVGHTFAASGLVNLVAMAQAMRHQLIPPSLHCEQESDYIDWANSPFRLNREATRWPSHPRPRLGAISAFGMSGTNAHLVLASHDAPAPEIEAPAFFLLVLSARSPDALRQKTADLCATLRGQPWSRAAMWRMSRTLLAGRQHFAHRTAVVVQDAGHALRAWEAEETLPYVFHGKVGHDFTAQKSLRHYGQQLLAQCADPTVSAEILQEHLLALAELFSAGYDLDWDALFGSRPPALTHLPTYPFARDRYWVENSRPSGHSTEPARLHPLAQRNTSTLSEQRFSAELSAEDFVLRDHVVQGGKVLPAAAQLELALVAARFSQDAQASCAVELQHVVFQQPLRLEGDSLAMHIGFALQEDGQPAFEIYGEAADGGALVYSSGHIAPSADGEAPVEDLAALESRCDLTLDVEGCYATFTQMGLNYGPAFQALRSLRLSRRDDIVLARLTLPEAVPADGYLLHPSLLDGALQACVGFHHDQPPRATLLPFSIDKLQFWAPLPRQTVAVIRRAATGRQLQKMDLTLCDELGRVCAAVSGFASRELPAAAEHATLLAAPAWSEAAALDTADLVLLCEVDEAAFRRAATLDGQPRLLALPAADGDLATRYVRHASALLAHLRDGAAGRLLLVVPDSDDGMALRGLFAMLRAAAQENPDI